MYRIIESERLPQTVGPGEFHYSRRFEMGALACACGCGHRIMLNLLDQHSLKIEDGLPTVSPSILAADSPCLSHFWLKRGRVVFAEKWSQVQVEKVMSAQLSRHLHSDRRARSLPWWRRSLNAFGAWLKRWL